MAESLKDYMEKLDDLPPSICRNAQEIREIDEKVEKMSKEIQQRLEFHVRNVKKLSNEHRVKLYKETQALFKEVDKLSDRKVKIAQKMYDTVDNHIKEMDEEIAKFHEYQRKKYEESQAAKAATRDDSQGKSEKSLKKPNKRRRKRMDSKNAENEVTNDFSSSAVVPLDMPVDPNEPTYCVCHQVSFGQMVACDGPHCKNEWFHFQCVGLTSSPIGKWYCDDCKESRRKKNK